MTQASVPAVRRWFALTLLAAASTAAVAQAKPADITQLSLEQLMDVRITGASKYEQKQSEVAAAVTVLTREDIRNFGWRTLAQALASLPGNFVTYDRQYHYVGTRGFSVPGDFSTRVLISINGNRLNDSLYDGGPVGRQLPLDLDLVERIEFIPGPGGAVYGQNAMFGVVNLVTRGGADLAGGEVALLAQHPQALRAARFTLGHGTAGGTQWLVSASGLRARGEDRFFDYGAGVSGVAAGLDGERDRELLLRVAHGSWSFDLMSGSARKYDPTGAYLSDPLVPGQYQGDRSTAAQLQHEASAMGGALQILARAFAGEEFYTSALTYGGTSFKFPGRGGWHGGELRLLYTGLPGHKLLLGAEAQRNRPVEQFILDVAEPANDITINSPGWRGGLYLQDEWRLADTLAATLGLRVDRNDRTGTKISPRAALIWQPQAATTVKALYGRAHRAPNSYERDYDDGFGLIANPALRGERIDTVELVADHRVGSDLLLRASAYNWSIDDLIVLGIDSGSGVPQYQSSAPVQAQGLELGADKTWADGARLRASVSWQHVSNDAGMHVPNSPRWLARVNYSAPLPWAGLRLGWETRADGRRLTIANGSTGAHAIHNLTLRTERLAPGLEAGLTIENLLDKRYAHPGADTNWQDSLEQDGRSVRVALRWRF